MFAASLLGASTAGVQGMLRVCREGKSRLQACRRDAGDLHQVSIGCLLLPMEILRV